MGFLIPRDHLGLCHSLLRPICCTSRAFRGKKETRKGRLCGDPIKLLGMVIEMHKFSLNKIKFQIQAESNSRFICITVNRKFVSMLANRASVPSLPLKLTSLQETNEFDHQRVHFGHPLGLYGKV